MTVRRAVALLGLLVLLLAACGDDAGAPEPARTQLLRVYDTRADRLTALRLRVPIPAGWSGASPKDPRTPIGGTTREINDSCSLLVQFQTGNVGGPLGLPNVREVQQGTRALELDGRELEGTFRLYRADKGLVFSGGATGPGGRCCSSSVMRARGSPWRAWLGWVGGTA